MPRLEASRYLSALRADTARIVALAPGALDRPVPGCPGWNVADVLRHLGEVYLHKAASVRLGRRAPQDGVPPAPDDDAALLPWLDDALGTVLAAVGGDPEAPAWSWWPPDATIGFWQRRMAQETLVHRVDVEQAAGLSADVDGELAADGVDEVLTAFLPVWLPLDGPGAGLPADLTAHVAVRTTGPDAAGRSWDVRVDGLRAEVGGPAGDAPAVLEGPPGALLLWAWGRGDAAALRVGGDRGQVDALRRALAAATV
ncbi:maleylpyruvate isomerase family mycothiol-dependent enzyme [Kineococcus xinjiangensis]|uniref:maleylpyruvate isomerase family mycothiol-dependent enzyme n=1 Tax=Kineococcus xinjiangensis TaxID=512762 RepID=UPI001304B015|nr:maleylpyruvate isomerase family mycothiol-dependent enzyme [Kineococcus xinjiangensis]